MVTKKEFYGTDHGVSNVSTVFDAGGTGDR